MPRVRSLITLTVSGLGVLLLLALGFWQLERLEWKRALLADLARALSTDTQPLSLAEAEAQAAREPGRDFLRVTLRGSFDHSGERYLFSTRGGEPGWQVVTPLETPGGQLVLVDRGFVPHALRDRQKRPESLISGPVEIIGLLRKRQEPGAFTPENRPETNSWYWPDVPAMFTSLGRDPQRLAFPYLVQALPSAGGPALPRPVPPDIAAIPNNHFAYALTWFGLAIVLIVMTLLFLRRLTTPKRA
jgi:surfeit locus 1 family protein